MTIAGPKAAIRVRQPTRTPSPPKNSAIMTSEHLCAPWAEKITPSVTRTMVTA